MIAYCQCYLQLRALRQLKPNSNDKNHELRLVAPCSCILCLSDVIVIVIVIVIAIAFCFVFALFCFCFFVFVVVSFATKSWTFLDNPAIFFSRNALQKGQGNSKGKNIFKKIKIKIK